MPNLTAGTTFNYADDILNMSWNSSTLLTDNPCMDFVECARMCTQQTVISINNNIVMIIITVVIASAVMFAIFKYMEREKKLKYFSAAYILYFGLLCGMVIYLLKINW